jgi:FkbM family methyltransferase
MLSQEPSAIEQVKDDHQSFVKLKLRDICSRSRKGRALWRRAASMRRRAASMRGSLREGLAYMHCLSNGAEVFYKKVRGLPLPPLYFRNGIVWHHGPYDDPVLLFQEFYIQHWMPSLHGAPRGAVAIDVGANIGAATLLWASEAPDAVIYAYEPNPQAFATLKSNIASSLFKTSIIPHQVAIGSQNGEIELWIDVPTTLSTAYGDAPGPNGRKIKVQSITLDDAMSEIDGDVWFLKIDTEGAEGDILAGASLTTLRRCSHIILEWHDNIVPGVSDACRKRLVEAGFRFTAERLHPWNEGIFYCSRE